MNKICTNREQIGVILKPSNLIRSIAASVPWAATVAESMSQIEGYEVNKRIASLESSDLDLLQKLNEIEKANGSPPSPLNDWSTPVGEFMGRTVDLAIAYDSGFHSGNQSGKELIIPIAHGCIVGDHEMLVCKEALDLMGAVAQQRNGKAIALAGMARHDFELGEADSAAGLSVCRLEPKDEERWKRVKEVWKSHGLGAIEEILPRKPVKYSVMSWMGQEIGFIHAGEAEDVMCGHLAFSARQFDSTTISHFRNPRPGALKTLVTGVLAGRIVQVGSPVFTRNGELLGVISDTETYRSDAGRRAVIRSLIGNPHFKSDSSKS